MVTCYHSHIDLFLTVKWMIGNSGESAGEMAFSTNHNGEKCDKKRVFTFYLGFGEIN